MIDPMAGITDTSSSRPGNATGGEGKNVFDMAALQSNMKSVDEIHSFMGIVSGCTAGILGLTGGIGFAFFFFTHLFVSISIMFKMKFNLKAYTQNSVTSFLFAGLQNCGMSYMLFWTLFYGLVYLFEV